MTAFWPILAAAFIGAAVNELVMHQLPQWLARRRRAEPGNDMAEAGGTAEGWRS